MISFVPQLCLHQPNHHPHLPALHLNCSNFTLQPVGPIDRVAHCPFSGTRRSCGYGPQDICACAMAWKFWAACAPICCTGISTDAVDVASPLCQRFLSDLRAMGSDATDRPLRCTSGRDQCCESFDVPGLQVWAPRVFINTIVQMCVLVSRPSACGSNAVPGALYGSWQKCGAS